MVLKTKDPGFTRFSKIDLEMPTQYEFDKNFHTPGPRGCSRSLEILNIDENKQLLDVGSVTFLLEILNQHSLHVHLLFSLIEHYALVIF